jgi:hypothetical protein
MRSAVATAGIAAGLAMAFLIAGLPSGLVREPANAALLAVGVPDGASVAHDHTLTRTAPGVLGNDLNLLGSTEAILVSTVSHGELTLRSDGGYTYVPDARFVGTDSFRYRPSGALLATTASLTVTNATPVARADSYTWSGGTLTVSAPGVLANDTDADGDSLTAELVGGGVSGSLDLSPNGGFRLDPGGGFGSGGSFQYRVTDGLGWSATVTVTLTVAPAATPRPTPTPTPRPTPRPTPTPTPLPLPSLPLPSVPLPSLAAPSAPGILPSAAPSTPSASPPATPSPRATGEPATVSGHDDDTAGAGTPGSTAAGGGGHIVPAGIGPQVSFVDRIDVGADLSGVGLAAGFETWVVPAATVGGAGLLLLLFVGLQAGSTLVWAPAVRRLRDERRSRRR